MTCLCVPSALSGDKSYNNGIMARLDVTKTWKLFINGGFPRSESGRTLRVRDADDDEVIGHICRASRKDLRDAVEAARNAQPSWANRTAYNRGQIMYRMAEMLEGKRDEFTHVLRDTTGITTAEARLEVEASVDRLVCFAGWCDKFQQVLGCANPVASPHYNFTIPSPTGVVGVISPNEPPLLALLSLIAPAMCAGNTIIALGSEKYPLPTAMLGEVLATSDVPPGVINLLTGKRSELLEHFAQHREINALNAAGLTAAHRKTLQLGSADNLKRVTHLAHTMDDWFDEDVCASPWTIEPFVEMKTIWHPSAV